MGVLEMLWLSRAAAAMLWNGGTRAFCAARGAILAADAAELRASLANMQLLLRFGFTARAARRHSRPLNLPCARSSSAIFIAGRRMSSS